MGALNVTFFFLATRSEIVDYLPQSAAALPRLLPPRLRRGRPLLLPRGDRVASAPALPAARAVPGRGRPRALPRGPALLRGHRPPGPRGLPARVARGAVRPAERRARRAEPRHGAHQPRQVPLAAAAVRRAARADHPGRRPPRHPGPVDAVLPAGSERRRRGIASPRTTRAWPGPRPPASASPKRWRPPACARRRASPGTRRAGRFFVVGDRGSLAELEPSGAVVATHQVKGNLEDVTVHAPSGTARPARGEEGGARGVGPGLGLRDGALPSRRRRRSSAASPPTGTRASRGSSFAPRRGGPGGASSTSSTSGSPRAS